jgi:hypothetical protein
MIINWKLSGTKSRGKDTYGTGYIDMETFTKWLHYTESEQWVISVSGNLWWWLISLHKQKSCIFRRNIAYSIIDLIKSSQGEDLCFGIIFFGKDKTTEVLK